MSLIMTLYNHKGGVSKTTTTFNLGFQLAERTSARVLLVDADPQCNLTELFLGNRIDEDGDLPGTTLREALRERLEGAAHLVNVQRIQVVPSSHNPLVCLFRGDIDLNATEDQFALAHSQRLGDDVHHHFTYVAIHDTLRRLSAHIGARYVLIDVGPSAGSLTRSCFLATDAFFVPTAPDRFNVQAIGSLSRIIGRWLSEHRMIVPKFKELGLPISHGEPLFLGVIPQGFKVSKGASPKKGFQLWLDRLLPTISEELVPVLRKNSTSRNLLKICEHRGSYEAARIPDFGSMTTLMQEYSKPIYSIQQEDTAAIGPDGRAYSGVVWTGTQKRLADWRNLFTSLVDIVLKAEEYASGSR